MGGALFGGSCIKDYSSWGCIWVGNPIGLGIIMRGS